VSSAGGPGGADQRRVLVGRYRLDEVIGRGGMSTVYRGTDLALDRTVAVKVAMDPLLERDPVYTARFKREARAAASLNNPGVATVFDAGADGPTRYIVMEYVEGRDLSEILREDGPLAPPRAARIGEQIAATLAAAHAAGIVHRDIKPGNVMIIGPDPAAAPTSPDASREQVKVLDFGIARTPDGASLTQTASVLGTAPYMSPEQAMGQPADARSDIYSLGCVLYEMLTGKPPFMGDMPAAVLHQHVRVAAKPPSALRPSVPPALDALVLAMLAKAPQDRPQTAAEVRDRLAAYETATEPTQPITAATVAMPAADALAVAAAAAAAAADVPLVATVPQAATPAPAAAAAAGPGAPTAPGRRGRPPRRPAGPPGQGVGPWAVLAVIALVLLGAAVAYAVTSAGSATSSSSSSSNRAPAAGASSHRSSSSTLPASHSQSPSTSTIATTTTTTTTITTTTTPTTTTPTTTVPGPTGPAPPGQGGTPPGQGGTPPGAGAGPPGHAKKGKK
jgi:tRNA A-37 threonylcarbamoyl transferase component Bud32